MRPSLPFGPSRKAQAMDNCVRFKAHAQCMVAEPQTFQRGWVVRLMSCDMYTCSEAYSRSGNSLVEAVLGRPRAGTLLNMWELEKWRAMASRQGSGADAATRKSLLHRQPWT